MVKQLCKWISYVDFVLNSSQAAEPASVPCPAHTCVYSTQNIFLNIQTGWVDWGAKWRLRRRRRNMCVEKRKRWGSPLSTLFKLISDAHKTARVSFHFTCFNHIHTHTHLFSSSLGLTKLCTCCCCCFSIHTLFAMTVTESLYVYTHVCLHLSWWPIYCSSSSVLYIGTTLATAAAAKAKATTTACRMYKQII